MCKKILVAFVMFILAKQGYSQCNNVNIAAARPQSAAFSSYTVADQFIEPWRAFDDGEYAGQSRWSAADGGQVHYIGIDLGQAYNICKVYIETGGLGYPTSLKLQGSNDTTGVWTDLVVLPSNTTNYMTLDNLPTTGTYRYIRALFLHRIYDWGNYDVYQFEIYNRVPNTPPEITLASPLNGASYQEGSNIEMSATADDLDGTVSKVEFYKGYTKIGEDSTAPYTFTWKNVPKGVYSIEAKAIDNGGAYTWTDSARVVVTQATDWSITGNKGIDSTQFLGTTDSIPLVMKTNDTERVRISPTGNLLVGTNVDNGYKFNVNGNMNAGSLFLDSSFLKTYNPNNYWNKMYQVFNRPSVMGYTYSNYIGAHHYLAPNSTLYSNGWNASNLIISTAFDNQSSSGSVVNMQPGELWINAKAYIDMNGSDVSKRKIKINGMLANFGSVLNLNGNPRINNFADFYVGEVFHPYGDDTGDSLINHYGLYVKDMKADSTGVGTAKIYVGNTYPIYSVGAKDISYLAGNLIVGGATTPVNNGAKLQVHGSATLDTIKTGIVSIGAMQTAFPTDANIKLAVNGNIYAKKLKVSQSAWADYVFTPGYPLRPLRDVASFIQKNKHLPDVPSTTEVGQSGLDVGDNQALLLKKIEELTLYLIKQDKMIASQNKMLLQMKKEVDGLKKVVHKK